MENLGRRYLHIYVYIHIYKLSLFTYDIHMYVDIYIYIIDFKYIAYIDVYGGKPSLVISIKICL